MSVSKQIIFEEMERIEREEYDEDGNPKEEDITAKIREMFE